MEEVVEEVVEEEVEEVVEVVVEEEVEEVVEVVVAVLSRAKPPFLHYKYIVVELIINEMAVSTV